MLDESFVWEEIVSRGQRFWQKKLIYPCHTKRSAPIVSVPFIKWYRLNTDLVTTVDS